MRGVTWRPGCPVSPGQLRRVSVTYWGFDGTSHQGVLVVHEQAVTVMKGAFADLYAQRFPIRRMVPIEAYGGDDYSSIEADNTSAFNCRPATGLKRWSRHAYGMAIDVNPLENPYVLGGRTSHPRSRAYLDRRRDRPGMLTEGSAAVRAFTTSGWSWGGRWTDPKDFQHFSDTNQ